MCAGRDYSGPEPECRQPWQSKQKSERLSRGLGAHPWGSKGVSDKGCSGLAFLTRRWASSDVNGDVCLGGNKTPSRRPPSPD